MTSILRRAAISFLKTNARASSHAATAGGHGGKVYFMDFPKTYVIR